MINREDMLELTRRMNSERTCFTRIAGCYMDSEGFTDGTFNTNFLKLAQGERKKNLALAKEIPFAKTNINLKDYRFAKENEGRNSMWQLLMAIRDCGLKNDALMETFYEIVGKHYRSREDYAVFVFHASYDVPVKGADKAWLEGSEEVYEYLICAICPLTGEYEPGKPECGFLFPAFMDRSGDIHRVAVFSRDADHPHRELTDEILKCR